MVNIYIDLILVALVTIYIVDISGFTESWRTALARSLKISESAMRPLKPFDCGKCMTWWVCLRSRSWKSVFWIHRSLTQDTVKNKREKSHES